MAQPPAFQFYASDYLSSSKVQRMTLEAEGAYIRLLAYNWQDGFIPADIGPLSRMCKTTPKRMAILWDSHLRDCFVPVAGDPDRLVSPRLEEVRAKQSQFGNSQSKRAKDGWETRRGNARALPDQSQERHESGNALQSPVSNLQTPKKQKTSLRSVKTKCPDGMVVTDQDREWALVNQITIDLEAETEAMLDWARGKGELKADWQATRRNWWREAQRRSGRNHGTFAAAAGAKENPNTRAAQDFVSRKLAETVLPNIPDVREESR